MERENQAGAMPYRKAYQQAAGFSATKILRADDEFSKSAKSNGIPSGNQVTTNAGHTLRSTAGKIILIALLDN